MIQNVEWQNECLNAITSHKNILLSSPTGSGKTRVFLQWAKKKEGKPIYITAPIKALSNQRYRELVNQGYKVGLETGDIKNVPENPDFICCTQEIYTNKYVAEEGTTLIIDEFHYIFENFERSRTYIDALANSRANNILICSATMGNIQEVQQYIERVSGRYFLAYENNKRLTKLSFNESISSNDIKNSLVVSFSRTNCDDISDFLCLTRSGKYDCAHKKDSIYKMADKYHIDNAVLLAKAQYGVAVYYGALLPKEKLFVEELFEHNLIDTIVGTDALALGVNFPVENVIFTQLSKYYDNPITASMFHQLAGRAGRAGYFDKGNVYYCNDFGEEDFNYRLAKLYEELNKKKIENMYIKLTPNIGDILKGKTTSIEEARFISEYSTVNISIEDSKRNIEDILEYIRNYKVNNILKCVGISEDKTEEIQKKFHQNIATVYFNGYSHSDNCSIFTNILCGVKLTKLIKIYTNSFNDILQLREYIRTLPKQYRKGLGNIDNYIRNIDQTAIDIARGSITTADISKITSQRKSHKKADLTNYKTF